MLVWNWRSAATDTTLASSINGFYDRQVGSDLNGRPLFKARNTVLITLDVFLAFVLDVDGSGSAGWVITPNYTIPSPYAILLDSTATSPELSSQRWQVWTGTAYVEGDDAGHLVEAVCNGSPPPPRPSGPIPRGVPPFERIYSHDSVCKYK